MSGIDKSYIVHCAATRCTMGMRESKLVLRQSHGVFLKEKAQATIEDAKAEENIICFGGCCSGENPNMKETLREMSEEADKKEGVSYQSFSDEELMSLFLLAEDNGKQIMGCYTECQPVILSSEWDKEKEDVDVEAGQKALFGRASVTCKYGGVITIETTGQEE